MRSRITRCVRECLHLADGDGGGVAACLLGSGRQVCEGCIGEPVEVEPELGGVLGFQALEELLGGQYPSAGSFLARAILKGISFGPTAAWSVPRRPADN
jgi:hypothetical protein